VSGSLRDQLAAELKALLPAAWRFIPNQRMPQTISKVTAVLKLTRLEPLEEAPIGSLRSTIVLTVVSAHQDDVKAELELDDAVIEAATALDGHAWISWTGAEKVAVNEKYLGWDVTLTAITSSKE
jgi:hypothetical protein